MSALINNVSYSIQKQTKTGNCDYFITRFTFVSGLYFVARETRDKIKWTTAITSERQNGGT